MLCEESYPKVLAFCFLDEVQKEFIVRYDNFEVSSVKRPYAFIEYGKLSTFVWSFMRFTLQI